MKDIVRKGTIPLSSDLCGINTRMADINKKTEQQFLAFSFQVINCF